MLCLWGLGPVCACEHSEQCEYSFSAVISQINRGCHVAVLLTLSCPVGNGFLRYSPVMTAICSGHSEFTLDSTEISQKYIGDTEEYCVLGCTLTTLSLLGGRGQNTR